MQRSDLERTMPFCYKTDFTLSYPVKDLDAARTFLDEQGTVDMLKLTISLYQTEESLKYLRNGEHWSYQGGVPSKTFSDVLLDMHWELNDPSSGFVSVFSSRELTEDELSFISTKIGMSHADGMGSSFRYEPFANYGRFQSSFDWDANDYKMEDVTNNPDYSYYIKFRMQEIEQNMRMSDISLTDADLNFADQTMELG